MLARLSSALASTSLRATARAAAPSPASAAAAAGAAPPARGVHRGAGGLRAVLRVGDNERDQIVARNLQRAIEQDGLVKKWRARKQYEKPNRRKFRLNNLWRRRLDKFHAQSVMEQARTEMELARLKRGADQEETKLIKRLLGELRAR